MSICIEHIWYEYFIGRNFWPKSIVMRVSPSSSLLTISSRTYYILFYRYFRDSNLVREGAPQLMLLIVDYSLLSFLYSCDLVSQFNEKGFIGCCLRHLTNNFMIHYSYQKDINLSIELFLVIYECISDICDYLIDHLTTTAFEIVLVWIEKSLIMILLWMIRKLFPLTGEEQESENWGESGSDRAWSQQWSATRDPFLVCRRKSPFR